MGRLISLTLIMIYMFSTNVLAQWKLAGTLRARAVWITTDPEKYLYIITPKGHIEKWGTPMHKPKYQIDTISLVSHYKDTILLTDTTYVIDSATGKEIIDIQTHTIIKDTTRILTLFDTVKIIRQDTLLYSVFSPDLGKPATLQWVKPGVLMAYYKDAQTIVFYDNTLSELYRLPMNSIGMEDVAAVCGGPGRTLWIYDNGKKRLYLYNYLLKKIMESSFVPMELGFVPEPTSLTWDGTHVIMCDSLRATFVFDDEGLLDRRLEFKCSRADVSGQHVALIGKPGIRLIDRETLQSKKFWTLIGKPHTATHYTGDMLVVGTPNGIILYVKR
ncbi:MAG: hypothetical protein GXO48_06725 [Chlorobi bacterium]|nr:hypothetical protein [Chlorobiota bacterium]